MSVAPLSARSVEQLENLGRHAGLMGAHLNKLGHLEPGRRLLDISHQVATALIEIDAINRPSAP